jgi:hypothetical protein
MQRPRRLRVDLCPPTPARIDDAGEQQQQNYRHALMSRRRFFILEQIIKIASRFAT